MTCGWKLTFGLFALLQAFVIVAMVKECKDNKQVDTPDVSNTADLTGTDYLTCMSNRPAGSYKICPTTDD